MKVIVVGGGPAGMTAAIFAARQGSDVVLLEKNNKLGKKLFITGKGRCNITNACDLEDLFTSLVSNPKFMYSSFYSFSNDDVIRFFEELGLKTKIERGNRIFPRSDKSSDVISALSKEMNRLGVSFQLNSQVTNIITKNNEFLGVELKATDNKKNVIYADKLIIATGGISYPITGSTGDGYKFAESMGHRLKKTYPSLVPLNIQEINIIKDLQGLSLKNIEVKIYLKDKQIYKDFGELLFTHFGVSGPVILSASSFCNTYLSANKLLLKIDLKPALNFTQLDDRLLRDFSEFNNKQFKNSLDKLLPRKLIPIIINLSNINPEKKVNIISKEERHNLVELLKGLTFNITSTRGFNEAIITQGGIDVSEINPSTMESKLVSGVFFAGEVLDVDGLTGGYNLQAAWSTGYLAALATNN